MHGFGGNRWVMAPLCGRLRSRGFQVVNWGYRSLWKDIQAHARKFQLVLEQMDRDERIDGFHIVAHSMGGIVARVALQGMHPTKLRRIVMLCPPNFGSHAATRFSPYFGWLSTTLKQIQDTPKSFVNQLPIDMAERYEVGLVQAESDYVVASEKMDMPGIQDSVMVAGFHTSILFHADTAALVERFLSHGTFKQNRVDFSATTKSGGRIGSSSSVSESNE